jgi:hypothetical protein
MWTIACVKSLCLNYIRLSVDILRGISLTILSVNGIYKWEFSLYGVCFIRWLLTSSKAHITVINCLRNPGERKR